MRSISRTYLLALHFASPFESSANVVANEFNEIDFHHRLLLYTQKTDRLTKKASQVCQQHIEL